MKKISYLILVLLFLSLGGCTSKEEYVYTDETTNLVEINTSKGLMIVELYPDIAPLTVANFQKLVNEKFYDNLTFHRIVSGFMIQGGDPEGTGNGGSSETIKGEFKNNGITNNLSHERGVISMARSQSYDSASSQFFICHASVPSLDGNYAAFGRLVTGFKTLDELASVPVKGETPINPPVIKSIRFVTKK